jgi:hypothetical protein
MKWKPLFALPLLCLLAMPAVAQTIPFANNDRSCREYGAWAVKIIQKAAAQGCNVQVSREVLDPAFHQNWCMKQSLATMLKAHLVHRTGVAFRCANQGVEVR